MEMFVQGGLCFRPKGAIYPDRDSSVRPEQLAQRLEGAACVRRVMEHAEADHEIHASALEGGLHDVPLNKVHPGPMGCLSPCALHAPAEVYAYDLIGPNGRNLEVAAHSATRVEHPFPLQFSGTQTRGLEKELRVFLSISDLVAEPFVAGTSLSGLMIFREFRDLLVHGLRFGKVGAVCAQVRIMFVIAVREETRNSRYYRIQLTTPGADQDSVQNFLRRLLRVETKGPKFQFRVRAFRTNQ